MHSAAPESCGSSLALRWLALHSLNQGRRQPERPAQCRLFTRHFTIIALMVKARQMKDPVQRQNLDLLAHRMSQPHRILPGNVSGNRDIPGQFPRLAGFRTGSRRKRQHIRSLILSAKLPVQRPHGRAAGDQHIHPAAQPSSFSRPQHKAIERGFRQSRNLLLQNNQIALFDFFPVSTPQPKVLRAKNNQKIKQEDQVPALPRNLYAAIPWLRPTGASPDSRPAGSPPPAFRRSPHPHF